MRTASLILGALSVEAERECGGRGARRSVRALRPSARGSMPMPTVRGALLLTGRARARPGVSTPRRATLARGARGLREELEAVDPLVQRDPRVDAAEEDARRCDTQTRQQGRAAHLSRRDLPARLRRRPRRNVARTRTYRRRRSPRGLTPARTGSACHSSPPRPWTREARTARLRRRTPRSRAGLAPREMM